MWIRFLDVRTNEAVLVVESDAVPRSNEHVLIDGLDYQVLRVAWKVRVESLQVAELVAEVSLVPPP